MRITGATVLATGANGGIGFAFVTRLRERGAERIYAADIVLDRVHTVADARVMPLELDVTDDEQIAAGAAQVERLDVLINCAGILTTAGPLSGDLDSIERELQVHYLGPLRMTRAFLPLLTESGGAIVNMLSVAALSSMPSIGAYSSAKAAAHSMTQGLRAQLASNAVSVHGVYPGPVDTPMTRDLPELDGPKASPFDVAEAILTAVEAGEEDIFPDRMGRSVGETWRSDPKEVERQFAAV
jgi:NAD(P)-dependent dehydrogenase (short-subunit alcohol dehydrogenase family)